MHKYSTFWIEDEFRYNYFYKSNILRRFLEECITNKTISQQMLSQFNYITRKIPYELLIDHVKSFHNYQLDVKIKEEVVELIKGNRIVSLAVHDKYFTMQSNSIEEADDLLFQPLRALDPSFFIIEVGTTNSGWVSPVKKEILL